MRFDLLAVNVISTMAYALNLVLLVKILYGKKLQIGKSILFIILFASLNGAISYLTKYLSIEFNLVKSFIIIFVSVLLTKYLLNLDYKKSFIVNGIFAALLALSESLLYLIFKIFKVLDMNSIPSTFDQNIGNVILGNFIIYLLCLFMIMLIKMLEVYIKLPKNSKTIVMTIMLTFIILAANMWFYTYNLKGETNIVIFILVTALVLIYSAYIIFNIKISYKLERQNVELEQQKFYNSSLDKTLDNLRRFKHGYTNNINVLYSFVKSGEYDKLAEYFDEVIETNNRLNDTTALNIRNAGLYGIISSKIQLADELDVKIKILADKEVKDIKKIIMSELCEIVGVFLDNAVEAASESEEKIVFICIGQNEECISITIKNSYSITPHLDKIFEKGYSTKGKERGLGLWIVNSILENNKQVLNNTYIENSMFCQELIIRNKKGLLKPPVLVSFN